MLELLKLLLPVLLPLLKKNATDRSQAVEMGKVIQRSAMKTGDWQGVLAGGVIQRLGAMDDEGQAQFIEAAEALQAEFARQGAKADASDK